MGSVAPGTPGTPGTLTILGGFDLNPNASRRAPASCRSISSAAGASDLLAVLTAGSTVNRAGATLSLTTSGTINTGDQFTILTLPGTTGGRLGSFTGGSTITVGSRAFSISYTGGDGNDVTLTALAGGTGPSLVSTVLNGGIAYVDSTLAQHQHSMVENVVYSFSQAVSLSAANFTMTGFQGTPNSLVPNVVVSGSGTLWTVTFSGVGVNNATHSIGDGEYELSLVGVPGGLTNTFDFFRLLGDMDGDGTVSASDFSTLVGTFLRPSSDPLYLGADDLDGDHLIGAADLSQFTANFLHTVPITPIKPN